MSFNSLQEYFPKRKIQVKRKEKILCFSKFFFTYGHHQLDQQNTVQEDLVQDLVVPISNIKSEINSRELK